LPFANLDKDLRNNAFLKRAKHKIGKRHVRLASRRALCLLDQGCAVHQWLVCVLLGSDDYYANAAIVVLRAHAAPQSLRQ